VVVGIKTVLDETGDRGQDFVTGIEQRFQGHVERAGSAAGHNDVGLIDGDRLFLADMAGHGLPDMRIAGVGHIAVFAAAGASRFGQGFVKALRGGDVRIPKAEVEYILGPVLCLEAAAFFEHFANPGRATENRFDFSGNRHGSGPFRMGASGYR